ncbi:DnaJ sub C member 7 [Phlyctochytrium planicorne]|nr:DnaJ sub C member 7 [Phlyctochytrium planicorne]
MNTDSMEVEVEDPVMEAERIKAQANVLYKEKRYIDAIELYSKCIELQPSNPTYYGNRSAAYTMLGRHQESVVDCRTSLNLDPTQLKVYSRASKGLLFMGDINASMDVTRTAIALAQSKPELVGNVHRLREELATATRVESFLEEAKTALSAKDYAKSLKAIENAIVFADSSITFCSGAGASKLTSADLSNISPRWKMIRADALLGLRELAEAGKIVQGLLLSDSTNSEALAVRAEILYLNDTHPVTHVQQVLQQALAFDPDNKRARAFLKRVKNLEVLKKDGNDAFGKGDWSAAIDAYTRFLDEDPEGGVVKVKVLSNRATVRSKTGSHLESIKDVTAALELLELISFGPVPAESHTATSADCRNSSNSALFLKLYLRRADSSLKLSKYDEALRDYTFADGVKPGDREIQSAMRQTQNLQKQAKRKDYYKILELERGASDNEIKKSFRRMALSYHPDKQAGMSEDEKEIASAKFKEINEAYSVLSDPRKKEMFDSGMDIDGSSASAGENPFGGMGGFGGGADMEDIMRVFMGAGMGGGGGFPGGFHSGGFPGGGFPGGGGGGRRGYGQQGQGGHYFHFG